MESIKKLEDMIAGLLKPLPHIPADWRKWISENIWWITLVGVVVDGLAALAIYQAATYINQLTNLWSVVGVSASSGWTTSMMISIALFILSAVIMAMAITPLKEMKKKGWDLLFMSAIVSVVASVFNYGYGDIVTSIIGAAIGAVVGMYFLFEIRSHFNGATVVSKK